MKEGVVSTYLHLVPTKRDVEPERNVERQETAAASWTSQGAPGEPAAARRRARRSTSPSSERESRQARIEALRARVQAGTYRVESWTLAESILKNESHFVGAAL